MRYLRSSRRPGALLCAAAIALLSLSACGSSSDPVVARVGNHTITRSMLEHWTAVEAVLSYQTNPTRAVPKGVVPDPPDYADCIAYLKASAKLFESVHVPPAAELKRACRQKREALEHHVLDILLTDYWLSGEGAAMDVAVSAAEVNRTIAAQFPTKAAFRRFLALTGETAADERFLIEGDLMATKLQQAAAAAAGGSSAEQLRAAAQFATEFTARWSARTSCQPGYVVAECRQYKGAKSATGL